MHALTISITIIHTNSLGTRSPSVSIGALALESCSAVSVAVAVLRATTSVAVVSAVTGVEANALVGHVWLAVAVFGAVVGTVGGLAMLTRPSFVTFTLSGLDANAMFGARTHGIVTGSAAPELAALADAWRGAMTVN
jgi:hypothetical protein